MPRHVQARGNHPWRILATALTLGLLLPGAVVATPAAADSEVLNPLDQSLEFDADAPVLDETVLESLESLDSVGDLDAGADGAAGAIDSGRHSAGASVQHLGPCKQDFMDAPPESSYYTYITWMACEELTKGYKDHTFGVSQEITRKEAAVLIYRMSGASHKPGTARDFADVKPRTGDEAFTAISWMHERKIVLGYVNRGQKWPSFKPDQSISRAELAAYLFRFAGSDDYTAPSKRTFKDVPVAASSHRDASWLAEQKIVGGYTDGTFRPSRNVTRGETSRYLYGLETVLNGKPTTPAQPKPAPKPAPGIPLSHRYVVISDDGLNVRRNAGTQHAKVASLARNTKVVWTGRSKAVSGVTWREITAGTVRGWAHGGYLMRDFEAGHAKSSLSKAGTVRTPSTQNGITRLNTTWQAQPNGYWCGPASITIAMGAFGIRTTQAAMAQQAQTDKDGTWLHQMVRVADYNAPASVRYTVTTIPGTSQKATASQRIRFRDDMVRSIKNGVPGLVNIAATPDEQAPLHRKKTRGSFTLRHHMPVVGYNANTNALLVQDPWTEPFWVNAYELADMTVTRGYGTLKR